METPGNPSPFWPSANIQAISTMRAGFMNSDGCRVKPAISTHRVAPLPRAPGRKSHHGADGDQIDKERRSPYAAWRQTSKWPERSPLRRRRTRIGAPRNGKATLCQAAPPPPGWCRTAAGRPRDQRRRGAQEPVIGGPPPHPQARAVGSRKGVALRRHPRTSRLSILGESTVPSTRVRACTAARKASPRASKSLY